MADEVPIYDPAVHVEPDTMVRVEMFCACGMAHRQLDPVSYCLPSITLFRARHHGDGHGPVSGADAFAERETRREAAFRAAGRQAEYQPKDRPEPADPGAPWNWSTN